MRTAGEKVAFGLLCALALVAGVLVAEAGPTVRTAPGTIVLGCFPGPTPDPDLVASFCRVRPDGTGLRVIAPEPEGWHRWSVAADGLRIVATCPYEEPYAEIPTVRDDPVLCLLTPEGRSTIAVPDLPYEAIWSPDGTKLAVVVAGQQYGLPQLYVMSADGSSLRRLTDEGFEYPDWSPDGSSIVVTGYSDVEGEYQHLFVVDPVSRAVTQLTRGVDVAFLDPAWSPDGDLIAAVKVTRQGATVVILDADGSVVRPVASFGGRELVDVDWSPDGRWIVFEARIPREIDGRVWPAPEIWVVRADGTNLHQVRDLGWSPRWISD